MTEFLWVLVGIVVVVLLSYLVYSLVTTGRIRRRGDARSGGGFVGFGGGNGGGG